MARSTQGQRQREFEQKTVDTLLENDALKFIEKTHDENLIFNKEKAKEILTEYRDTIDGLIAEADSL
ncbi:MAG: hypothetical protein ILP07_07010 [Treponema sp.]|nr:hypothetical protein [Treponema sp.]